MTFVHPIIGQEAICSDGLGRVIAFCDDFPDQWIQVSTYVNDRSCKWDPDNVKLIAPERGQERRKKTKTVKGVTEIRADKRLVGVVIPRLDGTFEALSFAPEEDGHRYAAFDSRQQALAWVAN